MLKRSIEKKGINKSKTRDLNMCLRNIARCKDVRKKTEQLPSGQGLCSKRMSLSLEVISFPIDYTA